MLNFKMMEFVDATQDMLLIQTASAKSAITHVKHAKAWYRQDVSAVKTSQHFSQMELVDAITATLLQ